MGSASSDPYNKVRYCNPDDVFKHFGDSFYGAGEVFWGKMTNDINGMLDGFGDTNNMELDYSERFLKYLIKHCDLGNGHAADIGAGIGRVTENILQKYFDKIDLVEPVASFLEVAKKNLSDQKRYRFFQLPAQKWTVPDSYDCFWCQWTLMFLTDDDCVKFLNQCREHLKPNGIIIVKDNVSVHDRNALRNKAIWEPRDHSISRTYLHYISLFKLAGLELLREKPQPEWSLDLQPLMCWALRPKAQ